MKTGKEYVVIALAVPFIILAVVTSPCWYYSIYSLFDDTTITFQNNSGNPIQLKAKIVEVEQDGFEWEYKSQIKTAEKDTLGVAQGIKRIEYTVDQTEGEIEFDMWRGEDVTLVIDANNEIQTDYSSND